MKISITGRSALHGLLCGLVLALGRPAPAADPIPPGRLAVVDQYTKSMLDAGYERRGAAAHYPQSSIVEFQLPGKPQVGGWEMIADWAFFIYDREEEAKAHLERKVKGLRESAQPAGSRPWSLPGGLAAETAISRGTNDSEYLVGNPWVNAGAETWFRTGAVVVKFYAIASGTAAKGGGEAKAQQAQGFIENWSVTEAGRVWGGAKSDGLHAAVWLVLRAIRKLPPVMAAAPQPRARYVSDAPTRLVADDDPDPFCPPWYGWPATADESVAPALALVLQASTQQPQRLAQELTAALHDPEVNKQVYYLALAGLGGQAPLFNNLSARLPADDKLLRYLRGRQRFCRQQQEDEWLRVVADGQFCAGAFFTTVDALMSVTGFAGIQASGAVLSFAQLLAKVQEQDPKLRGEVPADAQKLVLAGTIQAHPDWAWWIGAPQGFAEAIVGRWKARWDVAPGPRLPADLRAQLAAVPTEGAWLDTLDARQVALAREFVFYRTVSEAFGKIFQANGWSHEERLPLEPAGSNRLLHLQARRESDRRAESARLLVPVVAWFAGRDPALARAGAGPATATSAGDTLFGTN